MRCNGDVTLQDKHVTFVLRISDFEWQQTKAEFIANGFIDSDNNLLNWDKRQYISDTSKHRVAKHRALHKNVTVTPCNVTVTPPEQIQNRTDTEQIQKKNTAQNLLAALGISKNVADDFIALRNRLKAPITRTSLNGIQREAANAGVTLEAALRVCCERSWRGFKADWIQDKGKSNSVQDARLEVARQIMGDRNGNDRQIVDIASNGAIEGYGTCIPETPSSLWQPDDE